MPTNLTIVLGQPGVVPTNIVVTPSPVVATTAVPSVSFPGNDPAWAVALRTAMGPSGITYTDTTTGVVSWTGAQLNSQITSIGNGTNATNRKRLIVSPGSTITLTGTAGINLASRSYFELILTGVNIILSTDGSSNFGSGLFFQNSAYIAVRGGTFQGQNPYTATPHAADTIDEQKSGAVIRYNCDHIELDDITWLDLEGFGVITNSDGNETGPLWPQYIWVHGCYIESGEMGMAAVSGRYLLWEQNTIAESTWFAIDFEPDYPQQGYEHVLIQENVIDRYGWESFLQLPTGGHTHWALAMNPADSSLACVMDDLTFRNNTILRGHVTSADGTPYPGGYHAGNLDGGGLLVRSDKTNTKNTVVITGNTSAQARTISGGTMSFDSVNGLTVTNNQQRTVGSAALVAADGNATGVHTVTPNTVT